MLKILLNETVQIDIKVGKFGGILYYETDLCGNP